MIVRSGKGYVLKSRKTGKPLSKPGISKAAAKKREQQVEYFKAMGHGNTRGQHG